MQAGQYGQNEGKRPGTIQRDSSNVLQLIAPLTCATGPFIYPAPTWRERYYVQLLFSTVYEKIMIGIIILSSLFLCLLSFALLYYREHAQVKASSPYISILMAVGGILCNISILYWSIENNDYMCKNRIWIWTISFHMFLNPLLSKSYRIVSIFNQQQIRAIKGFKDRVVVLYAILLYIPQLIINIVWSILDVPTTSILVFDPLRPSTNFTSCASDYTSIFVPLSLA